MTLEHTRKRILVRGAGDFATAIIHRLHRAGFAVAATELEKPLAVRRRVALSEAVYEGTYTVEGVTACLCRREEMERVVKAGDVPVVIDPDGNLLAEKWDIVIDARSAKRNLGTTITDAPIVIAIGPGFEASVDCHAVVETLPRAGMGRVMYKGSAAPDTGKPYPLDACAPCACSWSDDAIENLVFRAPCSGILKVVKDIGSNVTEGETIAAIITQNRDAKAVAAGNSNEQAVMAGAEAVTAGAPGTVRGMIRDGTPVKQGMKLGDIDPTASPERCSMISEKARAIAGGVLEACMTLLLEKETARR